MLVLLYVEPTAGAGDPLAGGFVVAGKGYIKVSKRVGSLTRLETEKALEEPLARIDISFAFGSLVTARVHCIFAA